jgi:hypothetical protein
MGEIPQDPSIKVHSLDSLDISILQHNDLINGIKKFSDYKTLLDIVWDQDHDFDEIIGNIGRRIENIENAVRGSFHGRVSFAETSLVKKGLIIDSNTAETMRGYLFQTQAEFHPTGKRRIHTHFGVVMGKGLQKSMLTVRPFDTNVQQFDVISNPELDAYHTKAKKMGAGSISAVRRGGNRRPLE